MKTGQKIYIHDINAKAEIVSVTAAGAPKLVRVWTADPETGELLPQLINIIEKGWKWSSAIATILGILLKLFGRG